MRFLILSSVFFLPMAIVFGCNDQPAPTAVRDGPAVLHPAPVESTVRSDVQHAAPLYSSGETLETLTLFYDQWIPTTGGNGIYGWCGGAGCFIADDFLVPAGETWYVLKVNVDGYRVGELPVRIRFYADNGDKPGTLVFNADVDCIGACVINLSEAATLVGGGKYWLAIRTGTTSKGPGFIWYGTDPPVIPLILSPAHWSQGGKDWQAVQSFVIRKFVLYGTREVPAFLTLEKTIVNDDFGTAVEADFQASISGDFNGDVDWDVATVVGAGSFTASETVVAGYTAGSWGGDCAADGSVTLAPGENKTCTITNDDDEPAACTAISGDRIVCPPSRDVTGRTDADNIEAALSSVAPGGTVLLEAGEFFTSRPIAVEGFNGALRGSGIDATSIEAVKTSQGNQEPTFEGIRVRWYDDSSPAAQLRHTMFYFEDPAVSLKVSDLTLQVIDWYPVWRCQGCWGGLDNLILVTMAEDVDTHFDHVRLEGGFENGQGNVEWGIRLLGGESGSSAYAGPENWPAGEHSLTSSVISIPGRRGKGYGLTFARNSELTFSSNIVSSTGAIRLFDLDGSGVRVTANILTAKGWLARLDYEDGWGLLMIQVRTEWPTNLLVDNNQLRTIGRISPITYGSADGVVLYDGSEHRPTLRALIENNEFHVTNTLGTFAGVFSYGASEGVTIAHNSFHGTGIAAVAGGWAGGLYDWSRNGWDVGWVLHGNNFTGMEAWACDVCLGPQSQDWTVVGGGSSISVIDIGTSNSIVGVSDLRAGPPGPELSKSNRERREFRDQF